MIQLFQFQTDASDQIADRFQSYMANPLLIGQGKAQRAVPFFQALASITASGKTVILADAVSTIAAMLPIDPVVLWLSRGKVVVEQTFTNLLPGGKYHHLLGDFGIKSLAEHKSKDVEISDRPMIFFATVGTFNQRDKELGTRLIYRSEIDTADSSTWEALKAPVDTRGFRRPLVIVYDEAHNLTDQQTDLLMELQPAAFLVASATMKLPGQLRREVVHLESELGWANEDLVTWIGPQDVVDSGLIKSTVRVGGYQAPMEETLGALFSDFREAEADAQRIGMSGLPKAIYICKTNIVEGDAFRRDDPKQPFHTREAPPILIWRYLTEVQKVPPNEVAVYCSLRFVTDYPPPSSFRHFKGGDKDYDEFSSGSYRHVIFNLGLQEGWDDPYAYFAYIDKSMESSVRVEQTIGRLLRQPDAKHVHSDYLNTAHFYIRVDKKGVFSDLLGKISDRLKAEAPEVRLVETKPGKSKPQAMEPRAQRFVYETAYDTSEAVDPVEQLVRQLTDYRQDDGTNTKSKGGRVVVQRRIAASDIDGLEEYQWEEFEHSNLVSARWVFQREVRRRFAGALGLVATTSPKFDALVGFGSNAYIHLQKVAEQVVDAYADNVNLKQRRLDPYEVGPALVRIDEQVSFENALHEGYSGLNPLELQFAKALDRTGLDWCRNPSRSGYGIPLITVGPTSNYYPDFLIWKEDQVFALDTTAPHILSEKIGRKLLTIEPPTGEKTRLWVRFVSEGVYTPDINQVDKGGYTVWGMKPDGTLRATHVDSVDEAAQKALGL